LFYFFVKWSGGRFIEGPQQSVPLIVQGSCRFCNAISRLCTTTSTLALFSPAFSLLQLLCSLLPNSRKQFNDLIRGGTLLYITSCPAAPFSLSSLSLVLILNTTGTRNPCPREQ